jgi:iron complex outermembrane recepter protein
VGRSLQRLSAFSELQASLLPARWLPWWIHGIETDLAGRYTASSLANESNFAPTGAIKVDFGGASRSARPMRPPIVSYPLSSAASRDTSTGAGPGWWFRRTLFDPKRGNQEEMIEASDAINPTWNPRPRSPSPSGVLFERGKVQHFRASLEFVDTVTSGEQVYLDAQQVVDLESLFPQRVIGRRAAPGTPTASGITDRSSREISTWPGATRTNWTASVDYTWTKCLGGAFEAYCRLIDFQRYDVEVLPTSPPVDELNAPRTGSSPASSSSADEFRGGLVEPRVRLRDRRALLPFRILPEDEWATQGSDEVDPYWQFDAYLQGDLGRWLPWKSHPLRPAGADQGRQSL